MSCTISPLTAWILLSGPEPYGALSKFGLLRLFALMSKLILLSDKIIPVTEDILLLTEVSRLVPVIIAVLTNVCPACIDERSDPVKVIVPPLPAGNVQIFHVSVGT